ncbi:hypothetical protein H8D29_06865 [PVC group bacterium]|nr:hypothetical protein [PVC group bacterium]
MNSPKQKIEELNKALANSFDDLEQIVLNRASELLNLELKPIIETLDKLEKNQKEQKAQSKVIKKTKKNKKITKKKVAKKSTKKVAKKVVKKVTKKKVAKKAKKKSLSAKEELAAAVKTMTKDDAIQVIKNLGHEVLDNRDLGGGVWILATKEMFGEFAAKLDLIGIETKRFPKGRSRLSGDHYQLDPKNALPSID